ncbi:33435_t:CDS:1, partial [Gigaspora margarita]
MGIRNSSIKITRQVWKQESAKGDYRKNNNNKERVRVIMGTAHAGIRKQVLKN